MRNMIYRLTLLLLTMMLMTACLEKQNSEKEMAFAQIVQIEELNTKIQFWDPRPTDEFKVGDSIFLSLENLSEHKIRFPSDYGARIFAFNEVENVWIEIQNGAKYSPPGNPQVSPKGTDSPGVIGVLMWPELKNEGKPIDIRVLVVGNVEKNNAVTDEQVGAYLDLTLRP